MTTRLPEIDDEEFTSGIAEVVTDAMKEKTGPLFVAIQALEARVSGLEAASRLRGDLDKLQERMARIEALSDKSVARLPTKGAA
jgi:hypothetical protein